MTRVFSIRICIARLYGGGPDLFVDPALIPSIQHPLTSSFPLASAASPVPPASHPATPRFLLSLLATANYLHIPSVTSQALLLVLSTIGPWTVTRYFGFAIGQGIGQPEGSEPEAAVGLDDIGQPAPAVAPKEQTSQPPKPDDVLPQEDEEDEEDLVKVSSLGSSTSNSRKHRAVSGASQHTFETQSIYTESPDDGEPTFFYGVVGDKIGEACACWLARWGADILALEEAVEARLHPPRASTPPKLASPFPKLAHKRNLSQPVSNPVPQTFSSFFASMSLQSASNSTSSLNFPRRRSPSQSVLISPVVASSAPTTAPRAWSHGGMPARWARAVMCSDNLFVRGEWERFVFMTRVVELRRRQLAREATEATEAATKKIERLKRSEELEWDEMFKTGIYYSHIVRDSFARSDLILRDYRLSKIFTESLKSRLPMESPLSSSRRCSLPFGASRFFVARSPLTRQCPTPGLTRLHPPVRRLAPTLPKASSVDSFPLQTFSCLRQTTPRCTIRFRPTRPSE